MAIRVELSTDRDGNEVVTETSLNSANRYASSDNYVAPVGTIKATDGMASRYVADASSLRDNEVVSIGGMEIKVGMARDMGILDQVSKQSAPKAPHVKPTITPASGLPGAPGSATAIAAANVEGGWPGAKAALYEAQQSNLVGDAEANASGLMVDQLQLHGISVDDAASLMEAKMLRGLSDFDMAAQLGNPHDVALINDGVKNMQSAMEQSAKSELAPEVYSQLQSMAQTSPALNAALISYSIQRATGKANGVSWAEFLSDANAYMNDF